MYLFLISVQDVPASHHNQFTRISIDRIKRTYYEILALIATQKMQRIGKTKRNKQTKNREYKNNIELLGDLWKVKWMITHFKWNPFRLLWFHLLLSMMKEKLPLFSHSVSLAHNNPFLLFGYYIALCLSVGAMRVVWFLFMHCFWFHLCSKKMQQSVNYFIFNWL